MRRQLCGLLILLAPALYAESPPERHRLGSKISGISHPELSDKKATVVVFLSFDCPVSNSYAPTLQELHRQFAEKKIGFVGIVPGSDQSQKSLEKLKKEYNYLFPLVADPDFRWVDAFKATIAPEAFVLDHNQVLRYRGRIDNAYHARLRKNPRVTEHDLREAIERQLAGKPIRVPQTVAVGCPIVRENTTKKTGKVTYNRDVLPILQKHCQNCHRPGEVGPFSLMTYKQAVNWAADIRDYTKDRKMPPWKPTDGVDFHNDRRLPEAEIDTLAQWVAEGCPEGEAADAPPPATFTDGWQLGTPDLVLTVPEDFTLAASGNDAFRCFVLPTGLTEDQFVTAVEVRPGNKRVVHHTLNFFDTSGKACEMEKAELQRKKKPGELDFGPGYAVQMGVGFLPTPGKFGGIGGWAPGQRARHLPDGYGYPLPKGSDFILQVHYHRNGRVEKDRTTVGLYFAKKKDIKPYKAVVLRGDFLVIPAGNANFKINGCVEVLEDCELRSIMPHMHMLGKSIHVIAVSPDGKERRTLLNIDDWDYNWQETYFLKEPVRLTKGTKLGVQAVYDNSAKNPNNPFNPPQWVFFGEQTDQEMCFVFFGVTNDSTSERIKFRKVPFPKE
jgi:peroxiredoxin